MAENPIPGNPSRLMDLARTLEGGWETLRDLRLAMGQFQADDDWRGEAAEAFRQRAGGLPEKLGYAEARFWGTAQALKPYAEVLEEAQGLAAQGQQDLTQARADLRAARDAREREPKASTQTAVTNAEDAVGAAANKIAQAERMVEQAAGRCATAIAQTIDDPLRDPEDPLSVVWRGIKDFGEGLWDSTGGALAETVGAFLEDPGQFVVDAWNNLYDHVAIWNWETFVDAWAGDLKDLIAWDDWVAGRPYRAIGRILGNAALGFGLGKLALRILRPRGGGDGADAPDGGEPRARRMETVERRDMRNALITDSNPKFPLTKVNADASLDGPPGAIPDVAGPGRRRDDGETADLVFRDGDGNVLLRRDHKSLTAGKNAFSKEIAHSAKGQLRYDGEVWAQVKPDADVRSWVAQFQRNRSEQRLADYRGVRVVFRDPDGNVLGEYNLGERLPEAAPIKRN